MSSKRSWLTIAEEVDAVLVPSGMPFIIPAGTSVEITQAKGSSITINVNGQLARIDSKFAEKLGLDPADFKDNSTSTQEIADGPVDVEQIWEALKSCYDPEIPVNVVDLGLIYDIEIKTNDEQTQNHVCIQMTLTAPGCGMGSIIMQDVESTASSVANVTAVTVEMVFDPVWNRDMISEAGKLELGLL